MANLSESYDKAALVFSLLVALGLGALVLMAKGNVSEDFPDAAGGGGAKAPGNPNEELYKKTTEAVGSKVGFSEEDYQSMKAEIGEKKISKKEAGENQKLAEVLGELFHGNGGHVDDVLREMRKRVPLKGPVTPKGREIGNFVGTPMFLKEVVDKGKRELIRIDLGDPDFGNVHEPIPNQWWLDNHINPGWENSPSLDEDGDGFSNREEHDAKTDPNDPKSFGRLITKLQCMQLKKRAFLLTYSSDSTIGEIKDTDTFRFKHEEILNKKSVRTSSENIQPGKGVDSNVFSKGGAQMRYEFKKIEQRKFKNSSTKQEETSNFATLEDVAGAKKGDITEIKKGSSNGVIVRDWTAVLRLAAIGQQANELQIEERGTFSLPFDPNAAEKPYKFAAVSDAGLAIIEWEEGGELKSMELQPASPAN